MKKDRMTSSKKNICVPSNNSVLEIINLSKSFGEKKIFENFSFKFNKTGIYALIGESGVGKTTLLRMICGLDPDYNGKIIGGGKSNTSVLFQEYRLFQELSALDNAYLPNGEKKDTILLESAKDMLLKLGFKITDLNLKPAELSGGMKQRVSIVRALLRKKNILLLDEPTKELDSELRKIFYDIIRKEAENRLVILITHHLEDLEAVNAIKINI